MGEAKRAPNPGSVVVGVGPKGVAAGAVFASLWGLGSVP